MRTPSDIEAGLYHDDPDFDDIIDRLSNDLFQISSTNGKVSELLRRDRRNRGPATTTTPLETSAAAMELVQLNQQRFRDLKMQMEELNQWEDPEPHHKYSQHKMAADFARLFAEFRTIQEKVLEHAREIRPTRFDANQMPDAGKFADQSVSETLLLPGSPAFGDEEDEPLMQSLTVDEDRLNEHEVSYQQGLIADREEEIENIAQGMSELNEIYTNLGAIVRGQGTVLDNIEANIYSVSGNIQSGSEQLTKAHHWQRRSSGRMCSFLIILLIIGAFLLIAVRA